MSIVVVGAGVTGLTLAGELARAGCSAVLLEKSSFVGGLCRSFNYGSYTFDVGPHRLFSADPKLFKFFADVLDGHAQAIPRASSVYMNKRYLAWPLSPRSMAMLPPSQLAACLLDLVRLRKSPLTQPETLKDYVIHSYGPTIYRVFWEGYTKKFLGLPCENIDADWASLSVTRAVIDRKKKPEGLLALLASTLKTSGKGLHFLYPFAGMGHFPELLALRAKAAGAQIFTNTPVTRIITEGSSIKAIEAGAESFPVDELVWTGRLADLCRLLGEPDIPLATLSTLLFNVESNAPVPANAGQWVYFPDENILFSRVSFPSAFSGQLAPAGCHGLCVEVTTTEGSPLWKNPDSIKPAIIADLAKVALLPSPQNALACHIERISDTYPVYTKGYQSTLASVRQRLARFRNLKLVGRQACFIHDNIDEALAAALAEAREILNSNQSSDEPSALPALDNAR